MTYVNNPVRTNAKPNKVGSRWRGGTTERSGCPATGGRSAAKFVTTT